MTCQDGQFGGCCLLDTRYANLYSRRQHLVNNIVETLGATLKSCWMLLFVVDTNGIPALPMQGQLSWATTTMATTKKYSLLRMLWEGRLAARWHSCSCIHWSVVGSGDWRRIIITARVGFHYACTSTHM